MAVYEYLAGTITKIEKANTFPYNWSVDRMFIDVRRFRGKEIEQGRRLESWYEYSWLELAVGDDIRILIEKVEE